ncbi:MAG: glycerol-3-phosphate 1-O-acyltransferase PlsY [Candidatus Cloacimonetes bacterium]|nr:glycerol-3-phosphate 1-O-acyltransferase PlsY [Candidatus Cloacimonadota bacterium]
MPTILIYSVSIAGAYLLGSIPTAYLLGRIFRGIDIRQHGSRNVGATNAFRVLGIALGILTMLIDIGKGWLAVFLGQVLFPGQHDILFIFTGLSAILGHIYTIFLNFSGGKGVAASAGVFLALLPGPAAITLAVFLLTLFFTGFVSLSSLAAVCTLFLIVLVTNIKSGFERPVMLGLVTIVALFITIRHSSNIKRLLKGTENRVNFGRKRQDY